MRIAAILLAILNSTLSYADIHKYGYLILSCTREGKSTRLTLKAYCNPKHPISNRPVGTYDDWAYVLEVDTKEFVEYHGGALYMEPLETNSTYINGSNLNGCDEKNQVDLGPTFFQEISERGFLTSRNDQYTLKFDGMQAGKFRYKFLTSYNSSNFFIGSGKDNKEVSFLCNYMQGIDQETPYDHM